MFYKHHASGIANIRLPNFFDDLRCRADCTRALSYLDGHAVAALGGDDAVVPVVIDHVVVNSQEIAVVVGVEPVPGVVVNCVPPPVPLLVTVRVDSEIVVVDIRIVDVAVDVDIIEELVVTLVRAESTYLVRWLLGRYIV